MAWLEPRPKNDSAFILFVLERYRLAQLYMEGLGVPRDYVQAYIWLSLYGPDAAVDAKEHLSAAQVQEADRLIKSFCLDAASS